MNEQLNDVYSRVQSTLQEGINISTAMLDSCITFEPPFAELQDYSLLETHDHTHVLGRQFDKEQGIDPVKEFVTSRLWFTYRRDFPAIGGTGPTSDQGWGCMLRCAQMLMGEALIRRHGGASWNWQRDEHDAIYRKVLDMFSDEKQALYSIQQIAQMGVSEGKQVGEWFGPNTAAQVLKKLAVFDSWSDIAVHVGLDTVLVDDDCKIIAKARPGKDAVQLIMADGNVDESLLPDEVDLNTLPPWRPLLIIIPLRLGLTSINRCYLPAIQEFFKMRQCAGIIGGRPNHALYFIGITGDKLIYLDPHVCQQSLAASASASRLTGYEDGFEAVREDQLKKEMEQSSAEKNDDSYHCPMLLSMSYDSVDPSLALALYCADEQDYEDMNKQLKEMVLPSSQPALFELCAKRPKYWPPFEPYVGVSTKVQMGEFDDMGAPNYDSDDQFELLE